MKIQIKNYTFDKTAKTITFTDYSSIDLDSLLLITNVTDNIIIYNFADPLLGGTILDNVLTLTYNTAAMADTDKLQIFYEDSTKSSDVNILAELIKTLNELTSRLDVLAGMANSGAPALRVAPISSVSTAVTGSVTATVASTSITNFGTGIPAKEMSDDMNNMVAILGNINNVTP